MRLEIIYIFPVVIKSHEKTKTNCELMLLTSICVCVCVSKPDASHSSVPYSSIVVQKSLKKKNTSVSHTGAASSRDHIHTLYFILTQSHIYRPAALTREPNVDSSAAEIVQQISSCLSNVC